MTTKKTSTPASTEWLTSVSELKSERDFSSKQRNTGLQWIDDMVETDSFQEIGILGSANGENDGLICGWNLIDEQMLFLIADTNAGSDDNNPRTITGVAKASRTHQLAMDRGCPVIERIARPRRSAEEFIGAEFGVWGYGVDFNGLRQIQRASPRAILLSGAAIEQACLDCEWADYVVAGANGSLGLKEAIRPSADTCGRHGIDYVTDSDDEAVQRILLYIDLVTQKNCPAPISNQIDGGSTLTEKICDSRLLLPIKPVAQSGLQLFIGRINGISVGILQFTQTRRNSGDYARLEKFIALCANRHLGLLWIFEKAIDAEEVPLHIFSRVCQSVLDAGLPACHLIPVLSEVNAGDQLSARLQSKLSLPLETAADDIRQQVSYVLRTISGETGPGGISS